jgi:hypothetical protein
MLQKTLVKPGPFMCVSFYPSLDLSTLPSICISLSLSLSLFLLTFFSVCLSICLLSESASPCVCSLVLLILYVSACSSFYLSIQPSFCVPSVPYSLTYGHKFLQALLKISLLGVPSRVFDIISDKDVY